MVHRVGVEPTIPFGNQLLRLACMPIPPPVLARSLRDFRWFFNGCNVGEGVDKKRKIV